MFVKKDDKYVISGRFKKTDKYGYGGKEKLFTITFDKDGKFVEAKVEE